MSFIRFGKFSVTIIASTLFFFWVSGQYILAFLIQFPLYVNLSDFPSVRLFCFSEDLFFCYIFHFMNFKNFFCCFNDLLIMLNMRCMGFFSPDIYLIVVRLPGHIQLCNPINCSKSGSSVLYNLLELAQTHAHSVSDAIQPSYPLSSPFPPALKLSQHQGLFQWVSSLQQVAKVLELLPQHQSFQNIQSDFLQDWLNWSPCSPRDSQESSPAPQFESFSSLVLSLLYGPTLIYIHDYWKNHSFDYTGLCQKSDVTAFYMLSKLVIAFLPRSKHLLISWLQSP